MMSRIAVSLLGVSLLAAPALALEPAPKASPVASPAKIVVSPQATAPLIAGSPKPTPTPVKHAAHARKREKVASVKARHDRTTHVPAAAPAAPAAK